MGNAVAIKSSEMLFNISAILVRSSKANIPTLVADSESCNVALYNENIEQKTAMAVCDDVQSCNELFW